MLASQRLPSAKMKVALPPNLGDSTPKSNLIIQSIYISGVDECTHGIGMVTYNEALQNNYLYQEYQQT